MSFLTPLFILGTLGISLPVIFHLIRRSPRGRQLFSSLMFLVPSPPRITRRSRLDNLLLLLLRAAVLCLLALAFARPFLREAALLNLNSQPGKRIGILLDTSASMRRGDLWSRAQARVGEVLDGVRPSDQIALFTFDDHLRKLVGFEDGLELPPGRKPALVKRRASSVRPTWGATDLGGALVTLADMLDISRDAKTAGGDTSAAKAPSPVSTARALQVVLITDLQRGSRLDALQSYEWPEQVRLTIRQVGLQGESNAGVSLLAGRDPGEAKERERIRISNEVDSASDHFSLAWVSARTDQMTGAVASVYVPPGESRVVPAARPAGDDGINRIVLEGDDQDFDNTYYVPPEVHEKVTVLYLGREEANDPKDLRYYVERALVGGGRREVRFITQNPDQPLLPAENRRLIVVTMGIEEARVGELLRYMESGGTVLYILKDAGALPSLGALLECEGLSVEEAGLQDYAMLSEIDFSHPLFAPFADPRFSDFTKIRFWRHRRLKMEGEKPGDLRILARFDSGDPAILERPRGKGRILVLTSGWQPGESQLALSTKFVPLLASLLEHPGEGMDRVSFQVNEPIPLPPPANETREMARRKIRKPDGTEIDLDPADTSFQETDQPGIYELEAGGLRRRIAVNIFPGESKTAPLPVEELEQRGVRLGVQTEETDRQRQMRDLELESSQKLWRWLLVAALGLLILETWIAGRIARSTSQKRVVT